MRAAFGGGPDGWSSWSQPPNGLRYDIFANRFDPSVGWGDAVLVEEETLHSGLAPDLAAAADGNVFFVWQQTFSLSYQVWANIWDEAEGAFGEPEKISGSATATAPSVATSPDGFATAVWVQSTTASLPDLQVGAARYSPTTGWSDPRGEKAYSFQHINPSFVIQNTTEIEDFPA